MPTMPTAENFKNLRQYTILAATIAKNIAQTAKVPFSLAQLLSCACQLQSKPIPPVIGHGTGI
jgi:hypothetical protein